MKGLKFIPRRDALLFLLPTLFIIISCSRGELRTDDHPGNGWTDSFNTQDERWLFGDWTFDQNLCRFEREQASFSRGKLALTITKAKPGTDKPYRSAEVYTAEKYRYGRFKARMKPCSPPGVITSFFLMHIDFDTSWRPLDLYEIDIEFAGKTDAVQYALHWMANGRKESISKLVRPGFDFAEDFHDFEINWQADAVVFLIDGKESHRFDDPEVMKELDHPMNIHMNYWVSESIGWAGRFDPSKLPVSTLYDSVSVLP